MNWRMHVWDVCVCVCVCDGGVNTSRPINFANLYKHTNSENRRGTGTVCAIYSIYYKRIGIAAAGDDTNIYSFRLKWVCDVGGRCWCAYTRYRYQADDAHNQRAMATFISVDGHRSRSQIPEVKQTTRTAEVHSQFTK